jgi:hypothetical protein
MHLVRMLMFLLYLIVTVSVGMGISIQTSESGCMGLCPIGLSRRQRRRKKNEWVEECKSDPVLCKCGVEAKYGLVPLELDVGYCCGHMVDYEEVGICF